MAATAAGPVCPGSESLWPITSLATLGGLAWRGRPALEIAIVLLLLMLKSEVRTNREKRTDLTARYGTAVKADVRQTD